MAHRKMEMGLVLIVMAMLSTGAAAQSSCVNVLVSLSPCLNYITGNSSTPSSGCCSQLSSVVRSQPQCLCQVLNGGGSSLGININQTQALALPGACKVHTPPISQCNNNASGSPIPAPGPASLGPSTSPVSTPSAPSLSPEASSELPSPITPSLAPQSDTIPPLSTPSSANTGSGRSDLTPSSAMSSYSLLPSVVLIALGFVVLKHY